LKKEGKEGVKGLEQAGEESAKKKSRRTFESPL